MIGGFTQFILQGQQIQEFNLEKVLLKFIVNKILSF
jgi:hypothetical protein